MPLPKWQIAAAAFLCGAVAAGVADAQAFEVASVKPAHTESARFAMSGGPGTNDPGRISYTNIPLRIVLLNAYDLRNYQLQGPDWLDTLRFDTTRKFPTALRRNSFRRCCGTC